MTTPDAAMSDQDYEGANDRAYLARMAAHADGFAAHLAGRENEPPPTRCGGYRDWWRRGWKDGAEFKAVVGQAMNWFAARQAVRVVGHEPLGGGSLNGKRGRIEQVFHNGFIGWCYVDFPIQGRMRKPRREMMHLKHLEPIE